MDSSSPSIRLLLLPLSSQPSAMSLRLISRRAASLRILPSLSPSPSSSSVFLTLNRFKSSKDDVPETPRDPYPLPLSHPIAPDLDSTLAELTSFEIPPLDRSHEDMDTTRKRLVYQVRKRGMLEGDLLLATFARDKLPSMTDDEVRQFDKVSRIISTILSNNSFPPGNTGARRSRAKRAHERAKETRADPRPPFFSSSPRSRSALSSSSSMSQTGISTTG